MLTIKTLFVILLFSSVSIFNTNAFNPSSKKVLFDTSQNPLNKFSAEWNNSIYMDCNTAADENYLSFEEKNTIWILNMARRNPTLFLSSVLLNPACPFYKELKKRNSYDLSLIKKLKTLPSNPTPLIPDHNAYVSAQCHAYSSGLKGYVGHNRINSNCKADFFGECCKYGYNDALSIILDLLLDYGVPSLGHREICLSTGYSYIGVAIEKHTRYTYNAVLDFK